MTSWTTMCIDDLIYIAGVAEMAMIVDQRKQKQ